MTLVSNAVTTTLHFFQEDESCGSGCTVTRNRIERKDGLSWTTNTTIAFGDTIKVIGTASNNLWVTGADGSNPTAVTDFETGEIINMEWSRDGSRIYFTYGETSQNVALISNFR